MLVNFEIFRLSLNLSLIHLRDLSACYEFKGDLSSVMLKEIFHDSLIILKFRRICMENNSSVTWVAKVVFLKKILLIFGGCCNCYC